MLSLLVFCGLSTGREASGGPRPPDLLVHDGDYVLPRLIAANLDGDAADALAWKSDQLHLMLEPGTVVGTLAPLPEASVRRSLPRTTTAMASRT